MPVEFLVRVQADELVRLATVAGQQPAVATDADKAGHDAAAGAHFALQARNMSARAASLPACADPAQILDTVGGFALVDAIENGRPLLDDVVDRRLDARDPIAEHPQRVAAARFAGQAAAGQHAVDWPDRIAAIAERADLDPGRSTNLRRGGQQIPVTAVGRAAEGLSTTWRPRGTSGRP